MREVNEMSELDLESSQSQKFIFPTLQSILIRSWNDIILALGEADTRLAWERVQTFFEDVVPPKVEEECSNDYRKLKAKVQRANQTPEGSDDYMTAVAIRNEVDNVLNEELRPFMNRVKHSLFAHNYLEKSTGVRTHKTGVHKIGERLNP